MGALVRFGPASSEQTGDARAGPDGVVAEMCCVQGSGRPVDVAIVRSARRLLARRWSPPARCS